MNHTRKAVGLFFLYHGERDWMKTT